jgi:hypothetical protein
MHTLRAPPFFPSLALLFCFFSINASPSLADPPIVRLIAASTTSAAIDDVNGVHHVAIGPASDLAGRLLVFLPGTNATAQMYSQLIERTAELGYHAVGLAYVNQLAVNVICAGMGASGCHELVRREVILGTDSSTLVDVNFDNSIVNRLNRLLAYLETTYPSEGWDTYRDAGGIVQWNLVVVSGHSQGAGHTAYISKLVQVDRAVLFSGTEPAPWTFSGTFATPVENMYALAHTLEPSYGPIQASWDHIGIPGLPTSADSSFPPANESHQFSTSNLDCTGDPQSAGFYHNCASVDGWMPPPLLDQTPFFQFAWDHLFAVESPPIAVPALGTWAMIALIAALALQGATRSTAIGLR